MHTQVERIQQRLHVHALYALYINYLSLISFDFLFYVIRWFLHMFLSLKTFFWSSLFGTGQTSHQVKWVKFTTRRRLDTIDWKHSWTCCGKTKTGHKMLFLKNIAALSGEIVWYIYPRSLTAFELWKVTVSPNRKPDRLPFPPWLSGANSLLNFQGVPLWESLEVTWRQ